MFGDLLRKGLGEEDMQGQSPAQFGRPQNPYMQPQPMPQMPMFGGGTGQGFSPTPQGPDLYGQYNNPFMFLRRF